MCVVSLDNFLTISTYFKQSLAIFLKSITKSSIYEICVAVGGKLIKPTASLRVHVCCHWDCGTFLVHLWTSACGALASISLCDFLQNSLMHADTSILNAVSVLLGR